MDTSLISVIIPVYNVEKYLRECLDSVAAQTYGNCEVIMIDDGSTDASGAICDEYAARYPRFRAIHKENGGLSEARNTGLDLSSGEYVYFLDSDDFIEADALENLTKKAESSGADLVFFDAESFEDSGRGTNIRQGYIRKTDYGVADGRDMFDKLQTSGDFKSAAPLLFSKKSFLSEKGLSFIPGISFEDMVFSFEAFMLAGRTAHLREALYHRRFRSGSIMTSAHGIGHFKSAVRVYSEIVSFSESGSLLENDAVKSYVSRCAMRAIELYGDLPREDKKVCRKEYDRLVRHVREKKAYKSRALLWRTYGKAPWVICRAFERIAGR